MQGTTNFTIKTYTFLLKFFYFYENFLVGLCVGIIYLSLVFKLCQALMYNCLQLTESGIPINTYFGQVL